MGAQVRYFDKNCELEGYLATPVTARRAPGVLVVPSWLNVNESICRRADRLADLGYTAFVVDLFGAGVHPRPPQSPLTIVRPFLNNRLQFRQRLFAGLRVLQGRPECDVDRIAAVGYCIGGCGVLELARAGAPIRGVVSLHGLLTAAIQGERSIEAKILVLHGDADPIAPFEEVAAFREEMRASRANWELNIYGGARHSFTGEGILDQTSPEAGLHPQAEARSWRTTLDFLVEVLQDR